MSNAVAVNTPAASTVINIVNGYTSITGTDMASRKRVFAAVASAVKIDDNLDKPIALVDILVQPVSGENEETGEVEDYHRITLIDSKGVAYTAGSKGLFNSVDTLLSIFGAPASWTEPLTIKVVARKAPRGKYFAIELV